ncbi:MAG: polar amino acid transport system substrate-binding protein, partial [Bradyrhizobium sp.]|nr:polar amino acid transport system substrate-binding protein [Bradyrhizobium sp.]
MTSHSLVRSLSRRLMLGLLASQFALPMLAGRVQAASLDEIKKRGLIVATEDDFRPFEFIKDGKPTG